MGRSNGDTEVEEIRCVSELASVRPEGRQEVHTVCVRTKFLKRKRQGGKTLYEGDQYGTERGSEASLEASLS